MRFFRFRARQGVLSCVAGIFSFGFVVGCGGNFQRELDDPIELAQRDYRQLAGWQSGMESEQIFDARGATRASADHLYEVIFRFPAAQAFSSALSLPVAALGDVVIVSLFPVMGSIIQDRVEDAVRRADATSVGFPWSKRWVPSVRDWNSSQYDGDSSGESP